VPVFDLGRSYRNVRSGKSPEMSGKGLAKLWKIYSKLGRNLDMHA